MCDTGDRYTQPTTEATNNSESQPLESNVQRNKGTNLNKVGNIYAHQPCEFKVPGKKEDIDEKPTLDQM